MSKEGPLSPRLKRKIFENAPKNTQFGDFWGIFSAAFFGIFAAIGMICTAAILAILLWGWNCS